MSLSTLLSLLVDVDEKLLLAFLASTLGTLLFLISCLTLASFLFTLEFNLSNSSSSNDKNTDFFSSCFTTGVSNTGCLTGSTFFTSLLAII